MPKQQFFTERIPAVAASYQQHTERVGEVVQLVGHGLGGRPAERLMDRLEMAVSTDTIPSSVEETRSRSCRL